MSNRRGAGKERTAGPRTIKDLPEIERPRERMALLGPQELRTAELLAILLRSGYHGVTATALAEQLLALFGSLQEMAAASVEELEAVPGVKRAKACQIKAALELALRLSRAEQAEPEAADARDLLGSDVTETRQVVKVVNQLAREPGKECFYTLALDSRNKLKHVQRISIGGLDSTLAHPREVFERAIRARAAAVVVTHNHPSGDPTPSDDDIRLTRRLVEAGKVLGIRVHDHVVIAGDRSYSFRAHALL
jgi:DNA repair protein RadC